MELVTSWEREGRIKGRAEGLVEGQRLLVTRLLTRKLGALSKAMVAQIATLSASQLTALGEALLDFTTVSDVDRWLAAPPPPVNEDDDAGEHEEKNDQAAKE